tara:strand:+ start:121 stop:1026 length:906 start_codon:yes stop_codon:yes gene_type:complete
LDIIQVFSNVVLPVLLIAAAGALMHKFKPLQTSSLSQSILYLFSPALVFHGLATTEMPLENVRIIVIFSIILLIALLILGNLSALIFRVKGTEKRALVIAGIFMNAGNYGLPVAYFAFGEEGFATAIIFFVIQAILGWTVGIFLASRGNQSNLKAILTVFKVPTTYAAIFGFMVGAYSLEIPSWLLNSTDVLGDAAIPAMLIILGIQIASSARSYKIKPIILASTIRLVFSSVLAFVIASALNISPLDSKILIIVSGMPTAVFTIILATEYGGDPELSSSIVITSTLASLISVTLMLSIIG